MWTFFAHFSMHLHVGKHFIISTFLHLQFFLQPSRHPHFLNTVLFKFCLIKQWSCVTHWHFILLSVKDHVQFVCDSSVLAGMCNVPQIFTDTYETLWICWIKASRVGGSYRIPEFPRYLKIWYLATSTDGDISDSVTYNETKNDSIISNFPLRVVTWDDCYIAEMFGKQLNYLAIHPKISFFRLEKSLKYNHNLK